MSMPIINSNDVNYRSLFHRYCREHRVSQQGSRDPLQNAFFAYVSQERSRFFDSNKELYLDVLLRDYHAQDHGCVEFVQEGLIAKLHAVNPAAEKTTRKRERKRKNAKLLFAKEYLEFRYKTPLRVVRIDGTYNGTVWTATAVDVAAPNQRKV